MATTAESTRHALTIAQALAANRHTTLSIIAAPQERVTVSSARAHVHDLPVDDWDPNPAASVEVVRALTAVAAPDARIVVVPSTETRDIPTLLPTCARSSNRRSACSVRRLSLSTSRSTRVSR